MQRRYHPIVRVGSGALADVYFGVLESAAGVRRPIILKRAYADYSVDHPEAVAALVREARYATALLHPNVVQAYELVETEEGLILAMEYVPGLSVQAIFDHLRDVGDRLVWPLACRIVADAAAGLGHVHACRIGGQPIGLVHGDPSASNLLVSQSGSTRVVDFGAARSNEDTDELPAMGTMGYCSPEQLAGQRIDWRSDVFGLGAVLCELLTGKNPFRGGDDDETATATLSGKAFPIDTDAPAAAADLVRRMLVVDRERRSVQMAEVARVLSELAGAQGSSQAVAKWLQLELGDRLRKREARLESLINGQQRVAMMMHQATWTYVEHSLDFEDRADPDDDPANWSRDDTTIENP